MAFHLKKLEKVINVSRIANVHFFEFSKDYETVDDNHPFHELIFVVSGTVKVKSQEYVGILKKNDFIIHPPESIHSLSCPKNTQTSLIIIGFECSAEKLNYFASSPVQLDELEVKQLAEIVKEGRNVFAPPYDVPLYDMKKKKHQTFGSEQLLSTLIEGFLISLIRKYEFFGEESKRQNVGFEINEIIRYLDNNFLHKITIEELAFIFRTNRSTLCKEFKNATGQTIVQYLSNKKLEYAKDKLINTEISIQELSDLLNFSSIPNFYSFFKKYLSITPVEYRKIGNNLDR